MPESYFRASAHNPASWSRRGLIGFALASLTAAGLATSAFAQRQSGPAEVPLEELMKTNGLPDIAIGKPDAKITIIEYASLTCGHCAAFHTKVLPEIKKKYIETGQARLVMREFPLDNLAAAGAMLARCSGPEKSQQVIDVLFQRQDDWIVRGNPVPKLFEVVKATGYTQDTFDKCLTDQKLLDSITTARARASDKLGVNSTPTFFINGKRLTGAPTLSEFEKALDPLLTSGTPAGSGESQGAAPNTKAGR